MWMWPRCGRDGEVDCRVASTGWAAVCFMLKCVNTGTEKRWCGFCVSWHFVSFARSAVGMTFGGLMAGDVIGLQLLCILSNHTYSVCRLNVCVCLFACVSSFKVMCISDVHADDEGQAHPPIRHLQHLQIHARRLGKYSQAPHNHSRQDLQPDQEPGRDNTVMAMALFPSKNKRLNGLFPCARHRVWVDVMPKTTDFELSLSPRLDQLAS
ncbi:hypothetical protein QBC47DRAFT_179794 [Echria macrotheca]|uniref:Uncharacterized protein n=1 Tax=Echria macrotheca TaxID=438768 RepID=A0AAJ0BF32_9PEZI|nr:hypothetical protein QBC47DRAFT_179794 [Echria macrotheca]